jgi:hypothetical protein
MAKGSKASSRTTMDFEAIKERTCELDEYTVNFLTVHQDQDLAPMFASLPGGMCQCPHWGVMAKGRMTVRYADREEIIEAGDVFYLSPGHAPAVDAGSEFLIFSPTDQLAETEAAIAKGMQAATT